MRPMSGPARHLLIVDDSAADAELLKREIEKHDGYQATVVPSSEQALEYIRAHVPDLVLLDLQMPGVDGLDTLKRIKALVPTLPVAMVTGVWREEEAKRCFEAGAYEYITKPVDFGHLKNALLVKLL